MNWKKIGKSLIYPHIAVILVFIPLSVIMLVFSLKNLNDTSIFALISYLLSFYTLLVLCFRIPKIIAFFKKLKQENKYAKIWFSDVNLRIKVSLYLSLLWNIAYSILQLGLGIYNKSLWFYSMFVYYLFLALMRFFLVDYTKTYKTNENPMQEIKRTFLCGYMILFMNLALGVIITYIVLRNKTFEHGEIVTIALATYTFITFTFAIINCIKFRKYNSLVYSCAKSISLITAMVSMLTLESTMLSTFGENDSVLFNQIILSISGAVIIGFAITIAIIMIVRARREYKKLKIIQENN